MNRVVKLAVSILLTVTILTMSFSVFAVDPTPSPTPEIDEGLTAVDEKLLSYYIWLCMRAWGINISYEDSVLYNNNVETEIFNWVLEYLDTLPSVYSINQWIAPWQSSFDYWGNYRFNESALEDIQDFVDWLVGRFNLTDNSTVVINPTYSVNGYSAYKIGAFYNCEFPDGTTSNIYQAIELTQESGSIPIEYYAVASRGGDWYVIFLDSSGQAQIRTKYVDYNNEVRSVGGIYTRTIWDTNNVGTSYQAYAGLFYTVSGVPLIPHGQNFVGTPSEYDTFLANMRLIQEGNNAFVTATILLPFDDPDYIDGDSITIIGDKPDYSVIEWNGEVTVSNLPAVVSTGKVENPGIVEFFRPISALIDMAKTPFEIMVQIIYRFPVEVNVCIMSLMGAVCLFGIIKIMREH